MYHKISHNKILYFGFALIILYFAFHTLTGNRGVFAYFKILNAINTQNLVLKELQNEKNQLQSQLNLLHPKTFSLDKIDEIAKRDLGLLSENEKIIYLPH